MKLLETSKGTRLVMLPRDEPLTSGFDAISCVWIWDIPSETPEPNQEVSINVLESWDDDYPFKEVQKRSWGFYIPPRHGDHIILLATLGKRPVGVAYLNRKNFNLDFGVHVIKDLWRRRIGTRLIREALMLAEQLGARYLTVVRWLRKPGSASDRRAVAFYEACNPAWTFFVYRLQSKLR